MGERKGKNLEEMKAMAKEWRKWVEETQHSSDI